MLDTRQYEVKYADRHTAPVSACLIAESLVAQVNEEGHRHTFFDEILDHCTDGKEIKQDNAFITNKFNVKSRCKTTQGWEILVQWKDGSTTWVTLKHMKNSYPVQLADYAQFKKIDHLPAFAWWVPHVVNKRKSILSKTKSKYWVQTHNFGIEVPCSVDDALRIDKANGNIIWWQAICKEMNNVRPAFEEHKGTELDIPAGYQHTNFE